MTWSIAIQCIHVCVLSTQKRTGIGRENDTHTDTYICTVHNRMKCVSRRYNWAVRSVMDGHP